MESHNAQSRRFVVVTGLSGAGKSLALKCLEDQGYYCIDNMPPALIRNFAQLCVSSKINNVAAIVDVRGGEFFRDFKAAAAELPQYGFATFILFLEASNEVLVRRYSETRRQHPLAATERVLIGIEREHECLSDLRSQADLILDTSSMSPHQLKGTIIQHFASLHAPDNTRLHVVSFGFKYGIPLDTDLVFDCRFLPNPYYIPELKPLSGLDASVSQYIFSFPAAAEFCTMITNLIEFLMPKYLSEGKSHLTVAFGCTGGRHRSVAMAERLAQQLSTHDMQVSVEHRDWAKAEKPKKHE